jgi:hypothetical protein
MSSINVIFSIFENSQKLKIIFGKSFFSGGGGRVIRKIMGLQCFQPLFQQVLITQKVANICHSVVSSVAAF